MTISAPFSFIQYVLITFFAAVNSIRAYHEKYVVTDLPELDFLVKLCGLNFIYKVLNRCIYVRSIDLLATMDHQTFFLLVISICQTLIGAIEV